jgi:hypothetical protein
MSILDLAVRHFHVCCLCFSFVRGSLSTGFFQRGMRPGWLAQKTAEIVVRAADSRDSEGQSYS